MSVGNRQFDDTNSVSKGYRKFSGGFGSFAGLGPLSRWEIQISIRRGFLCQSFDFVRFSKLQVDLAIAASMQFLFKSLFSLLSSDAVAWPSPGSALCPGDIGLSNSCGSCRIF